MQTRARPRPRPGQKDTAQESESEKQAPSPPLPPPAGKADTQSRQKAESAHRRTESQVQTVDSEAWPRNPNGRPMAKITMTASELVPTGQYANVSVGPAQVTAFVDLDRVVNGDGGYFTDEEHQALAQALNELAEVVERDVIAVQRGIVLESMNEQLSS